MQKRRPFKILRSVLFALVIREVRGKFGANRLGAFWFVFEPLAHIIVLLTDGASNSGPDPLIAASQAAERGVRVYTIGFGTTKSAVTKAATNPAAMRATSSRERIL